MQIAGQASRIAVLLAFILTLGACQTSAPHHQGQDLAGTTSPSSSATHVPGGVLIVVAAVTAPDQPGSVDLYRLDGSRAAHYSLEAGSGVFAAAGSRIFFGRGDQLNALHPDGTVESLGPLGAGDIRWFASNPTGTSWLWSTHQEGDTTTKSAVHLGAPGIQGRVVEELTAAGQTLAPLMWTNRGAFIEAAPVGGHGGYFPFGRSIGWLLVEGSVHRLDPTSGRVTPVPGSPRCAFGDEASDNSVICFPGGSSVRLYAQSGKVIDVALAKPRFTIAAEAFCAPAEAICTVAGASGVGNGMAYPNGTPPPEQYGTDLIRPDGSISRFGPDGTDPAMGPQSWLPDGQLVLWRRPDAAGGAPGVYVLDRSGRGPFIPTKGEPVGYLG